MIGHITVHDRAGRIMRLTAGAALMLALISLAVSLISLMAVKHIGDQQAQAIADSRAVIESFGTVTPIDSAGLAPSVWLEKPVGQAIQWKCWTDSVRGLDLAVPNWHALPHRAYTTADSVPLIHENGKPFTKREARRWAGFQQALKRAVETRK